MATAASSEDMQHVVGGKEGRRPEDEHIYTKEVRSTRYTIIAVDDVGVRRGSDVIVGIDGTAAYRNHQYDYLRP